MIVSGLMPPMAAKTLNYVDISGQSPSTEAFLIEIAGHQPNSGHKRSLFRNDHLMEFSVRNFFFVFRKRSFIGIDHLLETAMNVHYITKKKQYFLECTSDLLGVCTRILLSVVTFGEIHADSPRKALFSQIFAKSRRNC